MTCSAAASCMKHGNLLDCSEELQRPSSVLLAGMIRCARICLNQMSTALASSGHALLQEPTVVNKPHPMGCDITTAPSTHTFFLTSPLGLYVRWMNAGGSMLASATPRKQPMPKSAHAAASSTCQHHQGQQGTAVTRGVHSPAYLDQWLPNWPTNREKELPRLPPALLDTISANSTVMRNTHATAAEPFLARQLQC
jgi:hypothetical protein